MICIFTYKKGLACLSVKTDGEYDPRDPVEPGIISWSHSCFEGP